MLREAHAHLLALSRSVTYNVFPTRKSRQRFKVTRGVSGQECVVREFWGSSESLRSRQNFLNRMNLLPHKNNYTKSVDFWRESSDLRARPRSQKKSRILYKVKNVTRLVWWRRTVLHWSPEDWRFWISLRSSSWKWWPPESLHSNWTGVPNDKRSLGNFWRRSWRFRRGQVFAWKLFRFSCSSILARMRLMRGFRRTVRPFAICFQREGL